jgi:hypothetical protein
MVPDPGHELLEAEAAPAATPEPAKVEAKPEDKTQTKPEDDEAEPGDPVDGQPVVARRAYEDERRKRQDWKEKAARAEGELVALRRQLEEAAARPAATPTPAVPASVAQPLYVEPPDPHVDLQGHLRVVNENHARAMVNERFNQSEARLRDRLDDEKVDAYKAEFQQAAQTNPMLWDQIRMQPDPYRWMAKEMDKLRAHKEIGDDPSAFRARVEQELRAKWEAEQAQAATAAPAQPTSSVPAMQPSLAGARSVAGRVAPAFPEDISLEEVLAPIQNRKNTNGSGNTYRW